MTAFKDGSLSALVSLISKATALVEAHYRASGKPYVPSLDDTEEHPLDKEIWPSEVRRAVQTIEAACEQLCATVSKPSRTVVNVRQHFRFGSYWSSLMAAPSERWK